LHSGIRNTGVVGLSVEILEAKQLMSLSC